MLCGTVCLRYVLVRCWIRAILVGMGLPPRLPGLYYILYYLVLPRLGLGADFSRNRAIHEPQLANFIIAEGRLNCS
jgi:hypothetical protein